MGKASYRKNYPIYIKDRTESFDDYFPCRKERCMLQHVRNWLNLFTDMHNKMLIGKEVLK